MRNLVWLTCLRAIYNAYQIHLNLPASYTFEMLLTHTYKNINTLLLQNIDNSHLSSLISLEMLDLSRNNLVKLSPGTFVGLTDLRYLDIGVNSLRTVSKL